VSQNLLYRLAGCALLAAIACLSPLCARAQHASLCQGKEYALFSCTLESKKILSACAAGDPSEPRSIKAVAYRYGTLETKEIAIPGDPRTYRQVLRFSEVTNKPESKRTEDDVYLRFIRGAYSYMPYAATGDGFDVGGVAVFKGRTLLKREQCVPETRDFDINHHEAERSGIPSESYAQALRFWKAILPEQSAVMAHPDEMQ